MCVCACVWCVCVCERERERGARGGGMSCGLLRSVWCDVCVGCIEDVVCGVCAAGVVCVCVYVMRVVCDVGMFVTCGWVCVDIV